MKKILLYLLLVTMAFLAGCGSGWGEVFGSYAESHRRNSEVQIHSNPNYWQEENARQEISDRRRRRFGIER